MAEIHQELLNHQKYHERLLAGAAMICGGSEVAQNCSWISPDILVDQEVKRFWANLLKHGDAMRAAIDANLSPQSLKWVELCPSYLYYEDYARNIAEDHFYLASLAELNKAVACVVKRDQEGVVNHLDKIRDLRLLGMSPGKSAEQVGEEFEKSLEAGVGVVLTHIPYLDNCTGGLFSKELVVVAARPGVGKTALVTQIARNVARNGKKVGLFSLEMGEEQLWARMACPMAGYSWQDVRAGNVSAAGLQAIKAASQELRRIYAKNLIIISDALTLPRIHQICTHYHFDLVVIDQLSEIRATNPDEKLVTWYGKVIKYLRDYVARNLSCPVLLAAQINRAPEGREDHKPTLSDLRDSGEIEQRSDAVWLCYREDMYLTNAPGLESVVFEVGIAKNRQGQAGNHATLKYDLKKQWFTGDRIDP